MNFLNDPIYRTSERKLIVQDCENNFSRIFSLTYSFDGNGVFGNEYDLWFIDTSSEFIKLHKKIYSGFDEDVYDYLKILLTGSNSFAILEELKKKGVI